MLLDKAVIPHYIVDPIPFSELKRMVNINDDYLKEKQTWYVIDNKLQYFKKRSDLRLFSEIFFQEFASKTLNLETLKYSLAYIRKRKTGIIEKESTLGLISENFQTPGNNYYLASELYNTTISDCKNYGDFSLVSLLNFFKNTVAKDDYKKIKDFLIRLFLIDAFTMQLDRNPNNIGFEIEAIDDLPYLKRLRADLIKKQIQDTTGILEETKNYELNKIIGLKPSKVYDNERILGIDHKFVFVNEPGDIWTPVFPFSPELFFGQNGVVAKETGKEISDSCFDGLDPNLVSLLMEYPNDSKEYFDILSRDDQYERIIENFCKPNSPICLDNNQRELFLSILKSRQEEFKNVLKLF